MSYTLKPRPSGTWTNKARNISSMAGRFNIGKFGQSRFGISDSYTRKARPSNAGWTDKARPTT